MNPLAWVYALLGLVDMTETHIGLLDGHVEANPFMATFADNLLIMWAVKVIGICIVFVCMNAMWKLPAPKWITALICGAVCIFQGAVVVHNYLILIGG